MLPAMEMRSTKIRLKNKQENNCLNMACNTISGHSIMFHFYSERQVFLAQHIPLTVPFVVCVHDAAAITLPNIFPPLANRKMVPIEIECHR